MEDLVKQISSEQLILNIELENALKGNKAAAARARKATLILERLYKQYRKESIDAAKK